MTRDTIAPDAGSGASAGAPIIGILGWEAAGNTEIYGSLAAPGTFAFPVIYKHVEGACYDTIIANPSPSVLARMIDAVREMEDAGIKAITTSCGFNSIFQKELADAAHVPVFTSALLLVPLIHRMLGSSRSVAVISADSAHLTARHLSAAGIASSMPVRVCGLEHSATFTAVCTSAMPQRVDIERLRTDVVEVARRVVAEAGDVGAIVLEMTILHAFSDDISRAVNLPVYDIVTLANFVYSGLLK